MTRKRHLKGKRDINKIIKSSYYDPKNTGGFGGKDRLILTLKNKKVKVGEISNWLSTSASYTLHKPAREKFQRRKYIVGGINALWQADLTDIHTLSKYNDNYKFILFNIDVFSRRAAAIPLKSKSANSVKEGFSAILRQYSSTPDALQTDKGTEFLGSEFQQFLKRHKIHHYSTENEQIKASLVERLQRTIKTKMFRYFTHTGSYRYTEVLNDFIQSYNNSPHSTTGVKPIDVNSTNQEQIWQSLYNEDTPLPRQKSKFNIGDRVRISKHSVTFKKGYLPNWSEEIFTISNRLSTYPPVYTINDESGSRIKGTWYEPELQRVRIINETYRVEKILSTRKLNGKTQYLVRWAGYPSSFDSYVNKADVITTYKN